MSQKIILAAGTAVGLTSGVFAVEFYVAPEGLDANPGTAGKPFATLVKAREAARAVPGSNTILLAPGRYFNAESIVLDDRDSGLTIKGVKPGATAEIYGGVAVVGWEKWKGDIWRAPVPKGCRFFNLIVDGKPATMAQTPNEGSGFRGGAEGRGNNAVKVPAEWRGYDYSDAQVSTFLGANWFSEVREVLNSSVDSNGVLAVDGGSGGFGGMNERFFLRGVLEFLDEPGEWCLKHKEGFIYYWPSDGSPAKHLIVRPTVEKLFEVKGRSPQAPAKGVTIENVSLIGSDFCKRWWLFGENQDGSTPGLLQQGLVFGENVDGLTVRNCRILSAGHSGVWLNYYAQNCVVENCLISGAGFAGVYANGFMPGEGQFKSGAESNVNRGHRVENNFIYDCGKFVGGGCGIQFYQAGDSLITRNEIGAMPRYGISFKSIHWAAMSKTLYGRTIKFDEHYDYIHTSRLKVTGNEIYSVCRNSFDFGAIESWGVGRDNLWAGNDLHDIDQALNWDGWAHVLFADDASDWLTIKDNIIHHCSGGAMTGAFMLKSIEQGIENNLVVDCNIGRLVTFEPYILPAWNMSIRHNIFAVDGVNSRYGGVSQGSINGKSFDGVEVPKDARGFREVNNNWINARDPKNPNPLAQHGMDLDSTFGPAPVQRTASDWDAVAADYRVSPAPKWFEPIDGSRMGLKKDFPFDKLAFTRRQAVEKIQAECYQRTHVTRTIGGYGICNLRPGAWVKYSNIHFGGGIKKAVFNLDARVSQSTPRKSFIRRDKDSIVEAILFKGDASVETVSQWEISKPYTKNGKTGAELFDEAFAPESDAKAGEWSLCLQPFTSKGGVKGDAGVVDFDVANGEGARNACAYARASIHAQTGRTNAKMTVDTTGGVKVWVNGELIISDSKPGTYSMERGVLKQGWNTILVKINQGAGQGGFSFKFGTVASACGKVVVLPGLPEAAQEAAAAEDADPLVELRLDSPEGRVIGKLLSGQSECAVSNAVGIHNLYLVFPGELVNGVDWFRFAQ